MVDTCKLYADEHRVLFNQSKSYLMVFTKEKQLFEPIIHLNKMPIKIVKHVNHLGHVVYNNYETRHVDGTIWELNKCVNMFISKFKRLKVSTKKTLYKNYCCSYYGSQLFNLEGKSLQKLCTAHRKGTRKIFNLPYTTHCKYLPIISDMPECHYWFCKRFLKMYIKCRRSSNELIKYISHVVVNEKSIWGKNVRYLLYKFNWTLMMFDEPSAYMDIHRPVALDEDIIACQNINELIDIRDGFVECCVTSSEANMLLNELCTN